MDTRPLEDPGSRPDDRAVPRRAAGGLRCRAGRRRIVRLPRRPSAARPDRGLHPPRRRRPPADAAQPPPSIRRADGRPVPAPGRVDRLGLVGRAGRRGRGRLPHRGRSRSRSASGLPVVVTLLDLAPWEMPAVYQRSPAAAFGQRLRGRILRNAAAVIVGSEATGRAVAQPAAGQPRADRRRAARRPGRVPAGRGQSLEPAGADAARAPAPRPRRSTRARIASGSACPGATSSIRAATTPARTSAR